MLEVPSTNIMRGNELSRELTQYFRLGKIIFTHLSWKCIREQTNLFS